MELCGKNQIPNPGVDPPIFAERPIFPKWGKPQSRVSPRMINEPVVIWSSGKSLESPMDNVQTWQDDS